jgi:mRNA-degrading endonuclease toxin of MazEF toxin-antitoxin module
VALCHQVTTLDRDKLETRVGVLSAELLAEIEKGLLVAVDIHCR